MTTDILTISREELYNKLRSSNIQIVNVLGHDHDDLGMIAGSTRIPLDEIEQRLNEFDRTKEIVVYCAGPSCPASREAAEKLAQRGYDVKAYEGGIEEWKSAGLPMD